MWLPLIYLLCMIINENVGDKLLEKEELEIWKKRDYKIGIVGGGASALLLSYRLYNEYGINNIDIYEATDSPSDSALTIADYIYSGQTDIATTVVPRSSYQIINSDPNNYQINFEPNPFFQSLLDKYDINKYVVDMNFINVTNLDLGDPTSWLSKFMIENRYPPSQLIQEIVQILLYYEQILLANDNIYNIDDYYNFGLTVKGETMRDFGDRLNLPIVSFMQSWLADVVSGIGPCMTTMSASYQHNNNIKFRIPFFTSQLYNAGFRYGDFPQYPFVNTLLNDPYITQSYWFGLKEGYQVLWDRMADDLVNNAGININYNSKVTKVKTAKRGSKSPKGSKGSKGSKGRGNDKISITYTSNNGERESAKYDKVFVTVRPYDALQLLNKDDFEKERDVYSDTTYAIGVSALYDIYESPQCIKDITSRYGVPADSGFVPYPYIFYAGKGIGEGFEQLYDCKITIEAYCDDATKIFVFGYVAENYDNFDDKEDAKRYCLASFEQQLRDEYNIDRHDLITSGIWEMGARSTVNAELNGWYDELNEIQGNPLYFTGDVVTGFGVPNVYEWINKNIG